MITHDSKKILIADDTAFFRSKLSAILSEVGHKIRLASNGVEVIEDLKVSQGSTDLLILDLQMPEIDGFGVIEWMHNNGLLGNLPVLIISGAYDQKEIISKLSCFNITDVMTKAFTPEQVVFRVNKILFESKENIRGQERVPVSIPVDFVLGLKDNTQTGFILNINADGLFLHSRVVLGKDSSLKMKFALPDSERLIEAVGAARWFSHDDETSGLFKGSGVVFTEISEENRELIREFVKKEKAKMSLQEGCATD